MTSPPADFQPTSMGKILSNHLDEFEAAVSDDLNTPRALICFESLLFEKSIKPHEKGDAILNMDEVLGFRLASFSRSSLRIRPNSAVIEEADIEAALAERKEARAAKDFAKSDAIRDDLIAKGVEVMDGDPLGWDWRLEF